MAYIFIFRHVLTAGHCLCHKEDEAKGISDFLCLEPSKNQIVHGANEMSVFGGSKSRLTMIMPGYFHQYKAEEAYIMDGSSKKQFDKEDIGLIKIFDSKPFFDKEELKKHSVSSQAEIIPICLAALNYDVTGKELRGVGWGLEYEESPKYRRLESPGAKRNPILSSCMTSEASPINWRFQNCNMHRFKREDWECQKTKPPPSYKNGNYEICNEYFREADLHRDPLRHKELKDMDVMYIEEGNGVKETCYQPALLKENGWCYLQYQGSLDQNVFAWGTCSNSCKHLRASSLWFDYRLLIIILMQINNHTSN